MTVGYNDLVLMNSACAVWEEILSKSAISDKTALNVAMSLSNMNQKLNVFLEDLKENNKENARFYLAERK